MGEGGEWKKEVEEEKMGYWRVRGGEKKKTYTGCYEHRRGRRSPSRLEAKKVDPEATLALKGMGVRRRSVRRRGSGVQDAVQKTPLDEVLRYDRCGKLGS